MPHWLDDLIQDTEMVVAKQRARQKTAALSAAQQEELKTQAAVNGHHCIVEILRDSQLEPHLIELVQKVLAEHPNYHDATLARGVEFADGLPDLGSSGFLLPPQGVQEVVQPLPWNLDVPNQRLIAGLYWELTLGTIKKIDRYTFLAKGMRASVTPRGLKINDKQVRVINHPIVEQAILKAYHSPITLMFHLPESATLDKDT